MSNKHNSTLILLGSLLNGTKCRTEYYKTYWNSTFLEIFVRINNRNFWKAACLMACSTCLHAWIGVTLRDLIMFQRCSKFDCSRSVESSYKWLVLTRTWHIYGQIEIMLWMRRYMFKCHERIWGFLLRAIQIINNYYYYPSS